MVAVICAVARGGSCKRELASLDSSTRGGYKQGRARKSGAFESSRSYK
jgi:hypothetical protein